MTTDVIAPGEDEGSHRPPPERRATGERGGFFHVYKKGQGYWTRMGTAAAAALIGALTAHFFYSYLPVWLRPLFDKSEQIADIAAKTAAAEHAIAMAKNTTIALCAIFLAVYGLIVFWLMNKPANADFLIATDSEMKKVNWTSRKELIGSTKVVIVFMFLIAFLLFAFDIIFGYLFYFMGVLKSSPFG